MQSLKRIMLGLAMSASAFSLSTLNAAIYDVDPVADSQSNGEALSAAIQGASSGDSLLLGQGIYKGKCELKEGVTIYGGFDN